MDLNHTRCAWSTGPQSPQFLNPAHSGSMAGFLTLGLSVCLCICVCASGQDISKSI